MKLTGKRERRQNSMKQQQGFSLIELLIVVAIIAIIAAIAVPSMLTSRMAANESGAIQGCRTIGSAEVAYSAINNQTYTDLDALVAGGYLDERFGGTFSGYVYDEGAVAGASATASAGFAFTAVPQGSGGRYTYGIASDQVVRWLDGEPVPMCGTDNPCQAGDPIGKQSATAS
jgi:type IV pilus assembly protein PilA